MDGVGDKVRVFSGEDEAVGPEGVCSSGPSVCETPMRVEGAGLQVLLECWMELPKDDEEEAVR